MPATRFLTRSVPAALALVGAAVVGAPAATSAAAPAPLAHLSAADALTVNPRTLFHRTPYRQPAVVTPPVAAAPAVAPAPSSTTYKFSTVLDGNPVRWNPCAPIHWASNTTQAPAGGLNVLKAAVAHVAAVTGTTWVYDGATTATPNTSWLPTRAASTYRPVLLGWTDGSRSDLLAGQPSGVVGMTRTVWFGTVNSAGQRVAATRAAVVALDSTNTLPLTGPRSWSAAAEHELGHVMGLDHPASSAELMSAMLPANVADYQAGDRYGLTRVGRTAGCVVVPGA